jgi:hypothetical protein
LSENFLPVEIDEAMSANRLVRVRVTGMNAEMELTGVIAGLPPTS